MNQRTYCVQVGVYSVKANANNMLRKLKAAGFPVFTFFYSNHAIIVSYCSLICEFDKVYELLTGVGGAEL